MIKVIKGVFPPMLQMSAIENKKYLITDGKWTEVPVSTQYSDIEIVGEVKQQPIPIQPKIETYTVEGSKGNKYTVTNNAGTWSCNCTGYGYRNHCKHIDAIKK